MITNEERREVAEKLRKLAGTYVTLGDLQEALEIDLTSPDVDIERDAKNLNRLADLIEPRTCRKVPGRMKYGDRKPACSECGYSLGDSRWNFCPKCGCEVVE